MTSLDKELAKFFPNLTEGVDDTPACECNGTGWIVREVNGNRGVRDCVCKIQKLIDGRMAKAGIPDRYRRTTLDSFDALTGHASLARGLAVARRFVSEYPAGTQGRGVLLVGPVGVGKTHLAIGMLRSVILDKGAKGLFRDFREILNDIKSTFNGGARTEAQVLEPIFSCDVLVLDELGAARQTDFSFDAIENIINGRYNQNKITIITTNLPNLGPGGRPAEIGNDYAAAARSAMREETLGDRIGARMHSRLQEMCDVVEVRGEDYRAKKGKR